MKLYNNKFSHEHKKNERKSWDETFLNKLDLQHKIRRSEQEKNREKKYL